MVILSSEMIRHVPISHELIDQSHFSSFIEITDQLSEVYMMNPSKNFDLYEYEYAFIGADDLEGTKEVFAYHFRINI